MNESSPAPAQPTQEVPSLRCLKCGYSLAGLPSAEHCPECRFSVADSSLAAADPNRLTAKSRKLALLGVLFVLFGYLLILTSIIMTAISWTSGALFSTTNIFTAIWLASGGVVLEVVAWLLLDRAASTDSPGQSTADNQSRPLWITIGLYICASAFAFIAILNAYLNHIMAQVALRFASPPEILSHPLWGSISAIVKLLNPIAASLLVLALSYQIRFFTKRLKVRFIPSIVLIAGFAACVWGSFTFVTRLLDVRGLDLVQLVRSPQFSIPLSLAIYFTHALGAGFCLLAIWRTPLRFTRSTSRSTEGTLPSQ